MADILLNRFCYGPHGTFGQLLVSDPIFTCWTVERPNLDNRANVSCIPEGWYPLQPRPYHRGGYEAIEICDVPNRSHILIHKGNTMFDVKGCVAMGELMGALSHSNGNPIWAVLDSGRCFDYFMANIYDPEVHQGIDVAFRNTPA